MKYINFSSILAVLLLAGCATDRSMVPPPLDIPKRVQEYSTIQGAPSQSQTPVTDISETPKPPPAPKTETVRTQPQQTPQAARDEPADITLAFEQMPLSSFIQAVYGATLKKNVSIDPAIVARQDLVTIRTGGPQTATQVAQAVKMLLKSYGIAVVDLGNLVRIVPDNSSLGSLPEIRRGRALPDTPLPLRPIFQLVELQAVRNTDIAQWVRVMFGDKVTVTEDPGRNAVWLSGNSENVTAALEAIQILDQPAMRGRQSIRITPAYISTDELAKRLTEILQAEGYAAGGVTSGQSFPISLVPVASVNALIVFTGDTAIMNHIQNWAKELDKPSDKGIGRSFFSYKVQYTDAQALAATLEKILSGTQAAKPANAPATAPPAGGRVVVDQASNTIIFQGSTEDYGQIRSLLELLDRPSKQALIEVTVAEVNLTDTNQLGVEWLLKDAKLGAIASSTTTIGAGGISYARLDSAGDVRILLNALATSNRATILSSPRVVSRNGETATIQVGNDVPIITSQQTNATTGNTGIIQTVQYRTSGVILKVRPVIHSGNQIDLDVSQEVSTPANTVTGVSSSPTFSTRKVDTKLSMKDGATVLLGGLISSSGTNGTSGLPVLKDIPVIGGLFGKAVHDNQRSELIILITPYVISNDEDAQTVTEAFRKQLGPWATTAVRAGQPPTPAPAPAPGNKAQGDTKPGAAGTKPASPEARNADSAKVPEPSAAEKPADSKRQKDETVNDTKSGTASEQKK